MEKLRNQLEDSTNKNDGDRFEYINATVETQSLVGAYLEGSKVTHEDIRAANQSRKSTKVLIKDSKMTNSSIIGTKVVVS